MTGDLLSITHRETGLRTQPQPSINSFHTLNKTFYWPVVSLIYSLAQTRWFARCLRQDSPSGKLLLLIMNQARWTHSDHHEWQWELL